MGAVLQKFLDALYSKQLEVVLIGLENSGKTTLLSVLASGAPMETVPTVGLDVKLVKRGGLQLKCWDIGGQRQYRSEWGRYTRGCDVVIFVVDAAAPDRLGDARKELHRLLEDRALESMPLLVAANKVDLTPHVSEQEVNAAAGPLRFYAAPENCLRHLFLRLLFFCSRSLSMLFSFNVLYRVLFCLAAHSGVELRLRH
jgi:ADP-ribosylation factor-like protein 8